MPRKPELSDYLAGNKISLAQRISYADPHVKEYVGSNTDTAVQIATLNALVDEGYIEGEDIAFIIKLLSEQNKAEFWSSEKTDIFTKLGGFKPQKERALTFGPSKKVVE